LGLFYTALLNVIDGCPDSTLPGAVGAAEEGAPGFNTMTDDLAATVLANGRELVYGTLEAVEGMGLAGRDYLK
jgi:hypothetical protein